MKAIIKAIIAGSVIIGVGLIILVIALALNGWKFMPKFEMVSFTAEGEIGELKIDNAVGNVKTEFYDGDKITVEYPVSERYSASVEEKEGVLTVSGLNKKHWYSFTFLPATLPETLIKIPKNNVLKLDVTVNAGKVELAAGEYEKAQFKVNAGSLVAHGVSCPELKCEVNAGSISLKEVESASLDCKVSAGSFHADRINCPLVNVKVSAGSVNLKMAGNKEEYTILVDTSAGSCNLASKTGTDPNKKIDIDVSAGSVNVSFI
ncbi:MAG: DUF4097 domain-containing protein [Clostridia bacterium]|nr:DUF4097 domain-containing protein [Clostridia bacterium]